MGCGVSVASEPAGKIVFPLVHEMAATGAPVRVPIAVALRLLGLSRQGHYQWLKAPVSQRDWNDAHLIDVLYDLHADDATLGYRFLTDEHRITVSEHRVHRLCRIAGIHASHHRKRSKPGSTGPAPHDDLLAVVDEHGVVRHEFVADGPNKVWLWDISEHSTREGKLRICAIKDVWSNKIAGYSIDTRMKSSLARAGMRNAIALRSPDGTICHSDRNGQFRAKRSRNLLRNNGLVSSMAGLMEPVTTRAWRAFSACFEKRAEHEALGHSRRPSPRDGHLDRDEVQP